jgi:hypothetical protein
VQANIQSQHSLASLRDIVEVRTGPFNKNTMTMLASVFVVLGLLSFAILEAGGAKKSAALAISICFIWAASIYTYNILVDHFTEGVNMEILTNRCAGDRKRLHGTKFVVTERGTWFQTGWFTTCC